MKSYTLELNPPMIEVIGKSLMQQPYQAVAPVIAELERQISAQERAVPETEDASSSSSDDA